MKYLVDANVLSEATKGTPSPNVIAWLNANESELVVDPIVLGEIRFGIHLLPASKRRKRLEQWFTQAVAKIVCLPWTDQTALRWAELLADLRAARKAIPIKDSLIAATALVHHLTVATHNVRDFRDAGVPIVDPFL